MEVTGKDTTITSQLKDMRVDAVSGGEATTATKQWMTDTEHVLRCFFGLTTPNRIIFKRRLLKYGLLKGVNGMNDTNWISDTELVTWVADVRKRYTKFTTDPLPPAGSPEYIEFKRVAREFELELYDKRIAKFDKTQSQIVDLCECACGRLGWGTKKLLKEWAGYGRDVAKNFRVYFKAKVNLQLLFAQMRAENPRLFLPEIPPVPCAEKRREEFGVASLHVKILNSVITKYETARRAAIGNLVDYVKNCVNGVRRAEQAVFDEYIRRIAAVYSKNEFPDEKVPIDFRAIVNGASNLLNTLERRAADAYKQCDTDIRTISLRHERMKYKYFEALMYAIDAILNYMFPAKKRGEWLALCEIDRGARFTLAI